MYDNRLSLEGPVQIPPELIQLGRGKEHLVIGLRNTVTDFYNNREIPLAIRMGLQRPYEVDEGDIEEQIGAYHAAFEDGKNPPYFVMVVTAEVSYEGKHNKRLAAILTEDVSREKTARLIATLDENSCDRVLSDGATERIFLDPTFPFRSSEGEKYLSLEARIDIQ